jgi:hypothetical protein
VFTGVVTDGHRFQTNPAAKPQHISATNTPVRLARESWKRDETRSSALACHQTLPGCHPLANSDVQTEHGCRRFGVPMRLAMEQAGARLSAAAGPRPLRARCRKTTADVVRVPLPSPSPIHHRLARKPRPDRGQRRYAPLTNRTCLALYVWLQVLSEAGRREGCLDARSGLAVTADE